MILRYRFRPAEPNSNSPFSAPRQPTILGTADNFLFGEVGVQRNGMVLSVLSMLARQGIDARVEVAYLSACPTGEAVARLTSRIGAAAAELADLRDPSALAADLIRLLPSHDGGLASSRSRRAATHGSVSGLGSKAQRDSLGHGESGPSWPQKPDFARLVVFFVASLTAVIIGIAAPEAIVPPSGSTKSATSVEQSAATAPAHPYRWYR
jgi:hypothetical protein